MPTGAEVFEQLSWHWEAQLRPRIEGVTAAALTLVLAHVKGAQKIKAARA